MGVAEVKRRFSEVLNRVELRGDRALVERHGQAVALISGILDGEEARLPRGELRGLAPAAGAWEAHEDIDRFLEELRASRDSAVDRTVEPFE